MKTRIRFTEVKASKSPQLGNYHCEAQSNESTTNLERMHLLVGEANALLNRVFVIAVIVAKRMQFLLATEHSLRSVETRRICAQHVRVLRTVFKKNRTCDY